MFLYLFFDYLKHIYPKMGKSLDERNTCQYVRGKWNTCQFVEDQWNKQDSINKTDLDIKQWVMVVCQPISEANPNERTGASPRMTDHSSEQQVKMW
ncbi:hypothetical protein RRG08_063336 [Elysia crispata]|uniref:Uncharacterized protein n=1 Tax=Elysia crispata TaxID=231223 RepID=A0AAE1B5H7_9GAST|nr:hypothetical protein RRG08_063336 [Elysia crispata]